MWIQMILIGLLFIVLIIVIYLRLKYNKTYLVYQLNDNFDTKQKTDELYQPFNELFTSTDSFKDADIITFSDYGKIDNHIDQIETKNYVYAVKGSDLMADKSVLATYFMKNKLHRFIPKTFVLGKQQLDIKEGNIYFLKKNIQRQEGTLITKDIKYIKNNAEKDGYVVCQELLQNPYLVAGRKVNMRFYMLVVCFPVFKIYIYNNGFIYYTPDMFVKNSTDKSVNITTGYIDREVYVHNPLSHSDLYKHMGKEKASRLQDNVKNLFTKFKEAYQGVLKDLNSNTQRFNVFGVDIAPDDTLDVKIMEVNKAPDLSYKDDRDAYVKLNMVKDMMNLIGIFNSVGHKNNFIQV